MTTLKITPQQLVNDLLEALALLRCAGPNPMCAPPDYWERLERLQDKYEPDAPENEG